MHRPPVDHGSDRYDYVEVEAPPGVNPRGSWWARLCDQACPDCRANVFAKWLDTKRTVFDPQAWEVTIAHDETCPAQNARERDGGG